MPSVNRQRLPTGCEDRGVLGIGSIPVAILPSCQDTKTSALYLHKHENSWVVEIRNTSEAVLILGHNTPLGHHTSHYYAAEYKSTFSWRLKKSVNLSLPSRFLDPFTFLLGLYETGCYAWAF